MENNSKKFWKIGFAFIFLILALLVIALFQLPDGKLHIIACDVGQGDAILVTYKNIQILTDGGPDTKVLSCLGKYVPFYDREIEMVINSHPDADHITGLTEVIKRYKVDKLVINPIDPGTPQYRLLQVQARAKKVNIVNPIAGQSLVTGLIHLDILSPTQDLLSRLTTKNQNDNLANYQMTGSTNLYSVVYLLSFKNFKALMLGDAPPEVSDALAINWSLGAVDYIKVPHHGSINGLTQNLLEKVTNNFGEFGVISVGKDNPWGFPSPQILKMLADKNIKVLRTDMVGDVVISTDGDKYWGGK